MFRSHYRRVRTVLIVTAALLALFAAQGVAAERAVGDTLTVITRPIISVPAIVLPGSSFTLEAVAPQSTTGWSAALTRDDGSYYSLSISSPSYDSGHERWFMTATVPLGVPQEMYDISLTASGGIADDVDHCVMVRREIDDDFYVVHITDSHLPTHLYYYESGSESDTTEMDDLRAVIDDINIMNPDFVIFTGDIVNEGELEDYLSKRYYTRAHRLIQELDVPVYLSAGNHDIGGWDDTPPTDGTARRNWWKFFGWRYQNDPAPDDIYTQNYSFDYGGAHFVGLEAYNNYDRWRRSTYGNDSFTDLQLDWLDDDLATVAPSTPVIAFYHIDFQDQLNISNLGIDCALWGHTHSTSGSTSSPPYDLSLAATCDGRRAMRVVHVSNGVIDPSEELDAGAHGLTMRVSYSPANDGTNTNVTATVINNHAENFEDALIKFRLPADSTPYEVDQGEIIQTRIEGSTAVCYVNIPLLASASRAVSISPSTGVEEQAATLLALDAPVVPNPTLNEAALRFSLGRAEHVLAEIFNVAGRRVATLQNGTMPAGRHELRWNADRDMSNAAYGVYFYRIAAGEEALTGRFVVVR